jgi:hypothetical protein
MEKSPDLKPQNSIKKIEFLSLKGAFHYAIQQLKPDGSNSKEIINFLKNNSNLEEKTIQQIIEQSTEIVQSKSKENFWKEQNKKAGEKSKIGEGLAVKYLQEGNNYKDIILKLHNDGYSLKWAKDIVDKIIEKEEK